MTYYVTYKVEARYIARVNANSIEEALQDSQDRFTEAFFGVAEDIEGEPIVVEDKAGNYVWEK